MALDWFRSLPLLLAAAEDAVGVAGIAAPVRLIRERSGAHALEGLKVMGVLVVTTLDVVDDFWRRCANRLAGSRPCDNEGLLLLCDDGVGRLDRRWNCLGAITSVVRVVRRPTGRGNK